MDRAIVEYPVLHVAMPQDTVQISEVVRSVFLRFPHSSQIAIGLRNQQTIANLETHSTFNPLVTRSGAKSFSRSWR